MNKRFKHSILALSLVGLGCCCFFLFRNVQVRISNDYVHIPVSFFPFTYKPLVKISIENVNYTVMLDTGSNHELDLHERVLKKIQDKKFNQKCDYYDIYGKAYSVLQFFIPEINIRNLKLYKVPTFEENIHFLTKHINEDKNSFFERLQTKLSLFLIDGRIGWTSLEPATSLFDFHDGSLFFAKNLEALKNENLFREEEFIKVPMELCKCGPVISVQTGQGLKKFLLDTGASHSVCRLDSQLEDKSLDMFLENINLGSWNFVACPIATKLDIDGILGVDFFQEHVICLDFPRQSIYIHKTRTKPSRMQSCKHFFRDVISYLR